MSNKFAWDAGVTVSQCAICKHLSRGTDIPVAACAAFPSSIPDEILRNEADHRMPWLDPATGEPGDVGMTGDTPITFEPQPGVEDLTLSRLYGVLDQIRTQESDQSVSSLG